MNFPGLLILIWASYKAFPKASLSYLNIYIYFFCCWISNSPQNSFMKLKAVRQAFCMSRTNLQQTSRKSGAIVQQDFLRLN